MPAKNPRNVYKKAISRHKKHYRLSKKWDILLAVTKIVVAAALLVFIFRLLDRFSGPNLVCLLVLLTVFAVAAVIHEKVLARQRYRRLVITINENELKSLSHVFLDVDRGEAFLDSDHPYSSDLDLFGESSLFHFLNRTHTSFGKKALAHYFTVPADRETLLQRQKSISELKNKVTFRQTLQSRGEKISDTTHHSDQLSRLLKQPYLTLGKKPLVVLLHLMPVLSTILLVLSFTGISWIYFLSIFLAELLINLVLGRKIHTINRHTTRSAGILSAYSRIIQDIEKESFKSRYLLTLKQPFVTEQQKVSRRIKALSGYLHCLELRLSSLHVVVNNIFLWDLNVIYRIEKWRRRNGRHVHRWLHNIGKLEALTSLANLAFNHPGWAEADYSDRPFQLTGQAIGHPLIPPRHRVCNNFTLDKRGEILIVTGPNMSGKSTFLKTVGINIVLAQCGAPVCARAFSLTPVTLYSSMKVSDSLDRRLSLFYAELQRLKMVLDAIGSGKSVFFIIDEMLKGTNALDRQKGALALIRQLLAHRSNGIIATHDLELTRLEEDFPDDIRNFHFDGSIQNERLIFDYRLRQGTCKSFNALVLMKQMGIHIDT